MAGNSLDIMKYFSSEIHFSKMHSWAQKDEYRLIKIVMTLYFKVYYEKIFAAGSISTFPIIKAGYKILTFF